MLHSRPNGIALFCIVLIRDCAQRFVARSARVVTGAFCRLRVRWFHSFPSSRLPASSQPFKYRCLLTLFEGLLIFDYRMSRTSLWTQTSIEYDFLVDQLSDRSCCSVILISTLNNIYSFVFVNSPTFCLTHKLHGGHCHRAFRSHVSRIDCAMVQPWNRKGERWFVVLSFNKVRCITNSLYVHDANCESLLPHDESVVVLIKGLEFFHLLQSSLCRCHI